MKKMHTTGNNIQILIVSISWRESPLLCLGRFSGKGEDDARRLNEFIAPFKGADFKGHSRAQLSHIEEGARVAWEWNQGHEDARTRGRE